MLNTRPVTCWVTIGIQIGPLRGSPGCSRAGKWPKRPILCELGSNNGNSAIARTVFKDMFISMVGQ